jgi:uncharacterized protein YceH (UPF0502 family)
MSATDLLLNPVEARVLGSLVEKEITTPDYFPLTLNALTNACNQSNNRDPVVSFGEHEVVRALDSLRDKKLAFLFEGAQSRVPKYGHRFTEVYELAPPETAALCVLLLRGPQTVGEIRGRSGRMHEFAGLEEAEATLEALAGRAPQPLVVKLPRQAGMKEQRYAHLLSGPPLFAAAEPSVRPEAATVAVRAENDRIARLEGETAALRVEVDELKRQLAEFRKQFE